MRKLISLLFLALFLLCGCNADNPISSAAFQQASLPIEETSSAPESTVSSEPMTGIGGSTLTPISSIPKPEGGPRHWGLSTLKLKGLELVEGGTDQQFGGTVGITYVDDNTVAFVTSYLIYEGELIKSPDKNLLRVYEYKISEKKLRQVYEERIGKDDEPHISGQLFIKKQDEKSLIITDTYFSFRLSLPDYNRIAPGTFEEPIVFEDELFPWSGIFQETLYKDSRPYIKEPGYANPQCTVYAIPKGFSSEEQPQSPSLVFKFIDGKKDIVIPINPGNTASEIDHYSITGIHFANKQPYFIALIGKFYKEPKDLPENIGANLYWWEDVLLVFNYETGEYGLTDGLNGISNLDNIVFNSSENECILQTYEIDQFKVPPDDQDNHRCYTFAYKVNIEEFIKNSKIGGVAK